MTGVIAWRYIPPLPAFFSLALCATLVLAFTQRADSRCGERDSLWQLDRLHAGNRRMNSRFDRVSASERNEPPFDRPMMADTARPSRT